MAGPGKRHFDGSIDEQSDRLAEAGRVTMLWWWDRAVNAGTVGALVFLGIHMVKRNQMLRQQARQMKAFADALVILCPEHDPHPPIVRKAQVISILKGANLR